MRPKPETHSNEAEKAVRDIRRETRRQFAAEEKVRIVIAGLRGEDSIAELCRKEGINQNLYYRWSKDFLEAGKKRLAGDTAREATSGALHVRGRDEKLFRFLDQGIGAWHGAGQHLVCGPAVRAESSLHSCCHSRANSQARDRPANCAAEPGCSLCASARACP
jgi:transposase